MDAASDAQVQRADGPANDRGPRTGDAHFGDAQVDLAAQDGALPDGPLPDGPLDVGPLPDGPLADVPPSCVLTVNGQTQIDEGEPLSVTLSCQGAPLDAVPTLTPIVADGQPPDGLFFDAQTGLLTWLPGLDQAGRYDFDYELPGFSAQRLTLWVSDAFYAPGNTPVDPETYHEEGGLPVVHLFPAFDINAGSDTPGHLFYRGHRHEIEAQYRGASSLGYPQKSYTIEFENNDPLFDGALSWPRYEDLVLLTSFDDASHLRQTLTHTTWGSLSNERLAPESFLVVVYLHGSFHGVYTGTERVKDNFYERRGQTDLGNLYKSVNHDGNFYLTRNDGTGKSTLHDGYEKLSGPLEPHEDGAFDDLGALVRFVVESDDETFAAELPARFPVDETQDWFILATFAMLVDSAGKNVFLYHQAGLDDAFHITPWDFNGSFGQSWETSRMGSDSRETFTHLNNIFARLLRHPVLGPALWARYRTLLDGPLAKATLLAFIDGHQARTDHVRARSWRRWGPEYVRMFGPGEDHLSEAAFLRQWVSDRFDFVDAWVTENGH